MKFAIVTGASRGLGESIVTFLLELGIHVYGISRSENKKLYDIAKEHNATFQHCTCDLGDLEATKSLIDKMKKDLATENMSQLYVVNNAALLKPIDQATKTRGDDLAYHFQVNVISPMMLINEFLTICTDKNISFTGANITSGAAERPIYGWSAYCSSKASLNMYTKTIALEQERLQTGHKIFAFSPGVMDTEMQAEIRASNYDQFVDVDTFKNYKKQNILSNTDAIAGVLVDILTDEASIENGQIYDVRDYF